MIRNFSRACLLISPESRPSTEALLNHRLFNGTGLLAEKDKIWKKELKAKAMSQKIKDMNLLFDNIETINRNADIQMDNIRSGDIINEDSAHTDQENVDLESQNVDVESEGKEGVVEGTLPNNSDNFVESNEIFPCQVSPSIMTESSENVSILQEIFGRVVIEHCQDNLTCRLLHRESILKTIVNSVECKIKGKCEAVYLEDVGDMIAMQSSSIEYKRNDKTTAAESIEDVKSMVSSSRMNSLGYKIASKMFKFFV